MLANDDMTGAVPAQPELSRMDGAELVLLGSHCPECGRTFFPPRWVCAVDQTALKDVDLSRTGTLHVATYIRNPAYGREQRDAEGYGVGEIDLPEGVRVQSVLLGKEEDWVSGAPFALTGESIGNDDEGHPRILFRFQPASQTGTTP